MADKSYDAVVIGGGHHGTTIAPYLAKAGLKVGVFERLDHLGGGAVSFDDSPAPGFRGNFCAHFTRYYGHPAYKEFNLRAEGLEYVFPDTNEAIIFDDGTSYVSYAAFPVVNPETGETKFSEENFKKTYEQIKRFSKADAEAYLDVTAKYRDYVRPAFHRQRYSVPTPWGVPDPVEELMSNPKSGLDPSMQFMTAKEVAHYFFESPELRILTLRGFLTSCGIYPDDVPGLAFLYATLHLVLGWETAAIAKGGTQSITDALVSAGKKMGVEYHINSEVAKVLIEDGKAKGIKLLDGTEIEAKQMVVSDNASPQLFLRLIGEDKLNTYQKRKVDTYFFDRAQLFWGPVGVHELPQYKAAKDNPDVNITPRTYWAPKDLGFMEDKYMHEIFLLGMPSKIFCLTAPDSIWDPTRAPEGKHSIHVEEFTAPARLFSRKEWRQLHDEFMDAMIEQWQKYAPNMTKDNFIGERVATPIDIQDTHLDMREGGWCEGNQGGSQSGRFRGLPGGYKTFVKNLYMCSSGVPGGAGIGRGSSYACYNVIADEHGLRKPTY
ncbi:phytoene desaturase family protein [Desulfatiglans anilini]|uniref:phytoene desaturase family protein n=1 Tax=Desulfatiglans anilini TaxID=90728 RepID=UPI00041740F2|nr:NAD(P)/FAD-dependent oxidoreductase [Desulfatiglans anilini]